MSASKFRKSVKRWSPFAREAHFEAWLARSLEAMGCAVHRQPVYMASASHIPSGKYTPKLDLYVKAPAAVNSLGVDLDLVVEIKNADNYSHLREAHRQVAAAMAGNDWRTAPKNGTQYRLGARPWRALVMTPAQLRREMLAQAGVEDVSTPEQQNVKPWAPELWELYDRQLWDHGASLLHMVGPDACAFWAHISGQIQYVIIRRPQ